MHVSGCLLSTPSLSAALYLLVSRFVAGQYAQVGFVFCFFLFWSVLHRAWEAVHCTLCELGDVSCQTAGACFTPELRQVFMFGEFVILISSRSRRAIDRWVSPNLALSCLCLSHPRQAFSMVEGCVTDLPLGREEAGSLRWLGHLDHDHHPDAVACRLKLSLAAAPCPEMSTALPWDIAEQVRVGPSSLASRQ